MTTVKKVQARLRNSQPGLRMLKVRSNSKAYAKSLIIKYNFLFLTDITKFKEAFEAAQKFNLAVKENKTGDDLVFAPAIEDVEEVVTDDPDKNTTADPDAAGEGGDDKE